MSQHLFADTLSVNSTIEKVTVYKQGALVSRKAHVKIPAGVTVVKIPMLSPVLDRKSVQVGVSNADISLGKVHVEMEMPNRADVAKANDSLVKRSKLIADSLDLIRSYSSVLDHERYIVLNNNSVGGSKGFDSLQLSGVASFLRRDLDEIVDLKLGYNQRQKKLEQEKQMLGQEMKLLDERAMMPKGALYISLVSKNSGETDLNLSYVVKEAEWTPFFELRISENKPSMDVTKKVMVLQKTKEDWKDVKMTVTRTNPTDNNARPELKRYTLPKSYGSSSSSSSEKKMVKVMGTVRDNHGSIQGVLVNCPSTNETTQTDASGFYEILVPENSSLSFVHTSHFTEEKNVNAENVMMLNVTMREDTKNLYGNTVRIRGVVKDAKEPLPFANVVIKGTTEGTNTDMDGNYEINVPIGAILEFSYSGYEPQTRKITSKTSSILNVTLSEENLEELVVVGYGVGPRKSRRSKSNLDEEELEESSSISVDQALAGKVSGVSVGKSSGRPGQASSVRIRGVSSLSGIGEPLYIVDGIPVNGDDAKGNPLANIDPNDIVSMEVLKNASASSINYSARVPNGVVVMITTKKGAKYGSGLYMSTFSKLQDYTAESTTLNTIPSDGSEHEATLGTQSIPANFSYYAAPKITPNVYMLAEVPNWRDYELLKGKLRVFLDNAYVGDSYWTPLEIQDTLHFSLGVEKNIGVERTLKATKEKKNLLRTAKKVTRSWQITVKNNKETAVDVVVEDQIPVATNDDAKVTLLESSNAKVDEKEGRLKWTLHLAPGEKKEININYEVKVKDEFLFDKLMSDQEL
ncbi:MAG: mucoidy inhibitor MuiA family protein [Paludibacteraceae bacterium]|nr:mucoidy inhibitor MuiA family protein [Paludibacteraceae bacterium]